MVADAKNESDTYIIANCDKWYKRMIENAEVGKAPGSLRQGNLGGLL